MPIDPMPRHDIYRRFIQCTCGEKVAAEDFEQHVRDREAPDIGRWIADAVLRTAEKTLRRRPE